MALTSLSNSCQLLVTLLHRWELAAASLPWFLCRGLCFEPWLWRGCMGMADPWLLSCPSLSHLCLPFCSQGPHKSFLSKKGPLQQQPWLAAPLWRCPLAELPPAAAESPEQASRVPYLWWEQRGAHRPGKGQGCWEGRRPFQATKPFSLRSP